MPEWQNILERTLRLLPPWSLMCLLAVQVFFKVSGYCGRARDVLRNTIEKVPDTGILAAPSLILSSNRDECSLVQHGNAVCNPERARHFVGHDDHRHSESTVQQEN